MLTKSQQACRKWRAKNAEYDRARCREYYAHHKTENAMRHRKWVDAHPERARALGNKAYHKNKNRRRAKVSQKAAYRLYGIDKAALLLAQNSCCAACGDDQPGSSHGWCVDHCHQTGKTRGILCHHCNVALGHTRDDPRRLLALVTYLETHRAS